MRADGVLDEAALMALVSQWQGARLKNRAPAQPDQLVTAPPSDFYDPGRAAELRQVERNAYEAYKEMIAAAAADLKLAPASKYLKIVSSYRSREYQDQLRRNSPNAGRAGLAVNSPHFTGRALDIYVAAVRSTRRIRTARFRSILLPTNGSCATRSASASVLTSTSRGTGNTLSSIHRLHRLKNLLAEAALCVTKVDRSCLRVEVDRLWTLFAHAVARFFCAAEGKLVFNAGSRKVHSD